MSSFGQNIRTCFPTGSYASIIAHASACLPLHSYPYSAFLWTAQAEGEADGLETPAGVYHGDRRSGTAATQRVLGDRESHPAPSAHGPCTVDGRRTHTAG